MGGSGLHQETTNHHEMVRSEVSGVGQPDPFKGVAIGGKKVVTPGSDSLELAIGLSAVLEPGSPTGVAVSLGEVGQHVLQAIGGKEAVDLVASVGVELGEVKV